MRLPSCKLIQVSLLLAGALIGRTDYVHAMRHATAERDSLWQVGEELTYNVSYASVDLGRVKISLVESQKEGMSVSYKAVGRIDTYKGVPFVTIHTVYESTIHQNFFSTWFRSRTKHDGVSDDIIYRFEYPSRRVVIEYLPFGKQSKKESLTLDTTYQDGLSLFFFARENVLKMQRVTIPTLVSEKKSTTSINFMAEHTHQDIDAVKYPVDVVRFEGNAGFVGIFGLTGDFEGWFSNDAARVPIVAKMKVLLGNIRIELVQWKRAGWNPPQYIEGQAK